MPPMPEGVEEGIIRGMYKLNTVEAGRKRGKLHVQLLGQRRDFAERANGTKTAWPRSSISAARCGA